MSTADDVLKREQGVLRLIGLTLSVVKLSVVVLSAAGIYALMSFTVARRRPRAGAARPQHPTDRGAQRRIAAIAGYNWKMPVTLTARERAHLKARAHALEPVVHVGNAGLTDKVAAEVERALVAHELIKVRIGGADRDAREALCDEICAR